MDKKILIKYIKGEATPEESDNVVSWISESDRNQEYYSQLTDTVLYASMSDKKSFEGLYDREMDESWDAVNKKISKRDSTRQHANIVVLRWVSIAAVLCVAVLVAVNLSQRHDLKKFESLYSNDYSSVDNPIQSYYTEKGVKGEITLPDGSIVKLNSDSKITFPRRFANDKREVSFDGEGYFDIAKNPDRPMIITTSKGMQLEVLGTTFHLCSYINDDKTTVTLISGSVNVSKPGNETVLLKPMESISFFDNKIRIPAVTAQPDTTKELAWIRGELIFDNTPLSDVIRTLERWHGVKFDIPDKSVLGYTFTADFDAESIVQIMEILKFTTPIKYSIKDNTVHIAKK